MLDTIATFSSATHSAIEPVYADPLPGRAASLAAQAQVRGIRARFVEKPIARLLETTDAASPVVLHIDEPRSVAAAIETAGEREATVLLYLFALLPNRTLVALRGVLGPYDGRVLTDSVRRFFDRLGDVSARSSGSRILGEAGRPEHRIVEPVMRQWFAAHFADNMSRALAGTRPADHPLAASFDGRTEMPVVVVDATRGWLTPSELAPRVFESSGAPLRPGMSLLVAELGPSGMRLHHARYRVSDLRIEFASRPRASTDPADRSRAAAAALRAALERVRPITITRANPVETTD